MSEYPSVAEQMKQLREERGLSQRELATLAGTTQQTINRIEHDLNSPSLSLLVPIIEALDAHLQVCRN